MKYIAQKKGKEGQKAGEEDLAIGGWEKLKSRGSQKITSSDRVSDYLTRK